MRMLAWSSLLQADGWVNRILVFFNILDEPATGWPASPSTVVLGLTYGYIPFFILPLYAALERLDERLLEAGRDLGASPHADVPADHAAAVAARASWPPW